MRIKQILNSINKIQSEMKDSLIKIKNNLQGNNSRVDEAENEINDLEHKEAKQNKTKNKKQTQPIRIKTRKKNPKNEERLRNLWYNFRCSNIQILGCQEEKRKRRN